MKTVTTAVLTSFLLYGIANAEEKAKPEAAKPEAAKAEKKSEPKAEPKAEAKAEEKKVEEPKDVAEAVGSISKINSYINYLVWLNKCILVIINKNSYFNSI